MTATLAILGFLALLGTAAAGLLPDLYTFGDSLTDTGNALRISNGAFPNTTVYPKGRFTNEPGTWANHVQLRTVALTDFSVGGATACFYPDIKGKQAIFPSMAKQVAAWLNTTRPVGKKVVVLWGGHNDIMSAVKLPPKQIPGVPKQVVTCLASMADQILKADKDATVLIASLAPINLTPLFGKVKQIQKLVNSLNKVIGIEAKLLKLKYGLNRVALWDINQVLADSVAKAPQLGFKVASSGSCVTYKVSFENFFTDLSVGPGLPCANPNDFVFYDPLHPTSKSHSIIANSYFAKLLQLKLISAVPQLLP